jgi:hypothetical protein
MLYEGGCHCGVMRVSVRLTKPAADMRVRSCACSFCRSHGTRTVSDPDGLAEIWATDWSCVRRYRFGSKTADYLICGSCGVYIGASCETAHGCRAVINTRCLNDRTAFARTAEHPDYEGETREARLARRAVNWMPLTLHG